MPVDDKMRLMVARGDFKRLEQIHNEAAGLLVKATIAIEYKVELTSRPADLQRIDVLVEDAAALVGKYTPCVVGCSACCYQAITITAPEADRIGKAIGRTPAQAQPLAKERPSLDSLQDGSDEDVARYTGKPCPFLVDHRCSVYEVRPVICRLHHSMHSDSSLCQHDEVREVPAINMSSLEQAFVATQRSYELADIRDFFPAPAGGDHG